MRTDDEAILDALFERIPDATFYTCDDGDEELTHDWAADALGEAYDNSNNGGPDFDGVTIYGYDRVDPEPWYAPAARRHAERILEDWGDEFAVDLNGDAYDRLKAEVLPTLTTKLEALLRDVLTKERVYNCKQTSETTLSDEECAAYRRREGEVVL